MQEVKSLGDIASLSIVTGAMMDWLPPIAAALTVIWTLLRIWETETVKRWTGRL